MSSATVSAPPEGVGGRAVSAVVAPKGRQGGLVSLAAHSGSSSLATRPLYAALWGSMPPPLSWWWWWGGGGAVGRWVGVGRRRRRRFCGLFCLPSWSAGRGPSSLLCPLRAGQCSTSVPHSCSQSLLLSVFTSLFTGQSLAPLPLLLHEVRATQPPATPTQCTVQSTQTLLGF